MATLNINKTTTVEALRKEFNDAFGAQVKIYNGNKVAAPTDTLETLGLTTEGTFECRKSLTVASFIERMKQEYGLKVKVYTRDEWVAVLDGLTLESAGKVKKNAVKADMESMLAYQRTESTAETAPAQPDAEAEKAKAEAERKAAENAAAAAKAELERIKAETAKAQVEAEKAKAAAAAAQAEKEKAEAAPKVSKTNSSQGALPGLFSIGADKKVRFSMGNLQFNAKKYEFRFAEHQWDFISEDDNKKRSATYDGWIDNFGYGTSGYMGCQPYESSTDNSQYPDQHIAGSNYDWGVYNPISNGGNKEGLWRTMTKEEWDYLVNKRRNASKLYIKGTVNGVKGYLLLPDDFYDKRIRIPIDSSPSDFSTNSYSSEMWKTLEEAGAVFLLYRNYWSATTYGSGFSYASKTVSAGTGFYNRSNHFPVRLVQNVK